MTTVNNSNTVSDALYQTMNPSKSTGKSSTAEMQDRFMTLLITQMKHQDPLNPMDNAAVTSQFAQLSTVSGIEKMNQTMASMMSQLQSHQNLQATAMIGRSVLAPSDTLALVDGKGYFAIETPAGADAVKIEIRNAKGDVVRTVDAGEVDAGVAQFVWDGKTDAGAAAPAGAYSYTVEATLGKSPVEATKLSYGQVGSVETGVKGVFLNVPGIGKVALGDIREVI